MYVELDSEADGGPAYVAKTVRLGPRMGSVYPVVAGLAEGDRVVTRGAFALDADLQIRGGPSMMSLPDDASGGPWAEVVQLPAEERARLAPVIRTYLEVQRALADDDVDGAKESSERLIPAIAAVELETGQEAWTELSATLRAHAVHVARARSHCQ